jgi:hypothetical protein
VITTLDVILGRPCRREKVHFGGLGLRRRR